MRNVTDGKSSNTEVSRAEFHLNERDHDSPSPQAVALAVAAFLLLVITKAASASTVPPVPAPAAPAVPVAQTAMTPDSCSVQLKTLKFAGTFSLKNEHSGATEPLRFVIGVPENDKNGQAVAQIWSGKRCQASCSSIGFETGDLSMPISLDLQCHGEALGPLSAHVAVLWDHGADHSTLVRFGSWLEGYEQAEVKVEVDHFNTLSVASRSDLNMPGGH